MAFDKLSKEREMFAEFYRICERYWDVKNTDEYWDALIHDTDKFVEKFRTEDMFALKIMSEFINRCERKSNERILND